MLFGTASTAAGRIAGLAWFMIIATAVIFGLVAIIIMISIRRSRHRDPKSVDLSDPGHGWILFGGILMPAAVLIAVLVFALRLMYSPPTTEPVLTIHVTGHQWWWQLDYDVPRSNGRFRSANELHVPVGQPVRLLLTGADVIHSFWVPRLSGKLDLIPGDTNELRIEALRVGRFNGACAEYCGAQHARMGLAVIADDSATFAAWVQREATDAVPPSDSLTAVGARLFASGPCTTCHTVRGLATRGEVGPDLTHVGARTTLGAGTLSNSLGAIEGWIANPQALKPGALMPRLDAYTGSELRALAAYVTSLK